MIYQRLYGPTYYFAVKNLYVVKNTIYIVVSTNIDINNGIKRVNKKQLQNSKSLSMNLLTIFSYTGVTEWALYG